MLLVCLDSAFKLGGLTYAATSVILQVTWLQLRVDVMLLQRALSHNALV